MKTKSKHKKGAEDPKNHPESHFRRQKTRYERRKRFPIASRSAIFLAD
jgi:hypothetical protein